jgi:hypothetical protein
MQSRSIGYGRSSGDTVSLPKGAGGPDPCLGDPLNPAGDGRKGRKDGRDVMDGETFEVRRDLDACQCASGDEDGHDRHRVPRTGGEGTDRIS